MNIERLKELLSENESVYLEFKEALDLRTNYGKAKLLREILSLANSPITRGYLVMGVEDKTKEILGVTDISEEQVQQIVTEWCHPPIRFDFHNINYHERNIVVLQVYPVRPPYTLRKALGYEEPSTDNKKPKQGKLMTNQVFIRRGSIIGEAETEEIIEMAQKETPDLRDVVAELNRMTGQLEDIAESSNLVSSQNSDREYSRTIETTFVSILSGLFLSWAWEFYPAINPILAILTSFSILVAASALRVLHFGILRAIFTSLLVGMFLTLVFYFGQSLTIAEVSIFTSPLLRFSFGLLAGSIGGIICQTFLGRLEARAR